MHRLFFIITLLWVSIHVLADVRPVCAGVDSVVLGCATEIDKCSSCTFAVGDDAGTSTLPIILIVALLSGYAYLQSRKYVYPIIGGLFVVAILSSSFLLAKTTAQDDLMVSDTCFAISPQHADDEFENTDDFIAMESESFSDPSDEFQSFDDDFISADDDEFSTGLDEFSSDDSVDEAERLAQKRKKHITELLIILLALVIIRLFKHLAWFRKLRPLFLLGFLIWLGFVRGGCPCMISSFHNLILGVFGVSIDWVTLLWFIGLIPVTYFFGKLWCGWLCHLGALQEFLFSSNQIEKLKTPQAQKVLHWIQVSVFVILVAQIAITRTNIFIHYDPFKVAFNLFSANITGYVLLVILLVSSLFVYRPFCRLLCPVGLVLSWVSVLKGARKITQTEDCIDCISCSKACKAHSIHYSNKESKIEHKACIACGECIDSCKKDALCFDGSIKK